MTNIAQRYLIKYASLQRVIIVAIVYYLGMVFFAGYLGVFEPTDNYRERNAAIGMPLLTAYSFVCNYYLIARARFCLFEFLKRNKLVRREKWVLNKLARQSWTNFKIALALGCAITFSYLYTEDLLALNLDPLIFFLNVSAIPFWSSCLWLFLQLIFVTRLIIKHFLDKERIGIFGNKKLLPLSDLVISNAVITVFFFALLPVFWINKDIPIIDKMLILLVLVVMISLLFKPVFTVHQRIAHQKNQSLERINTSIFNIFEHRQLNMRRLTDDPERLRRLSSLVALKQEVSSASEWPIDLPQSIRGVLVALSIPISWAIGSLVETLIASLI